ncbi:MAG: impB/mucB/samB family protein [Micavibrio aeruginosavorus]|nr:impB/mucB/samB family protein [Micavibrio aeruginosavorus]
METLAPQNSGLKWLFLDLNSYFASVEQQDNPRLRGRPVAVVPMETDYTCAIAASVEAKMYGVKTGTMIHEAKRLCPPLICVLARHDAYVRYHHKVVAEVARHTPINKIWSIDELSSRLPPNKRNRDSAAALAARIREGIWKNVGAKINCSIGVAPNSFLAKVATDMMKPNGLVILEPGDLPGRLFDLDLIDLPGINTGILKRLRRNGISTVEQLWRTSPKHARRIWGSVGGERFWYNLHGYDLPDPVTSRSTIGHSRILDPELRRPESARLVARRLTLKAASRLRRENLFATRFYFTTRVIDGPRWGMEAHVQPAQDNFTFLEALDDLWARMLDECRPARLKKIAVGFLGLKESGDITPDLFDTPTRQSRRNDALSAVIDAVNEKYGAEALRLGVSPRTQAGYVGTKIAFSRVPDLAEFNE